MKSRIMVSMLVIAMTAALIGGASMAWFEDADETGPVHFQAGTLLIDIDNNFFDTLVLEDMQRLNPGDEFEWDVWVENEGTKKLIYDILICWEDILGEDLHDFGNRVGYGTEPLSMIVEFHIWKDGVQLTSGSGLVGTKDKPLSYGIDEELAPGETHTYTIKAKFPTDAGNEYQGSKMRAAFVAQAKQVHEDAEYGDFECPLNPWPSTNYLNKSAQNQHRPGTQGPHVNFVSNTSDSVTLEFVMPESYLAVFEYRVDGDAVDLTTNPTLHPFGEDPHPNPRPWMGEDETVFGAIAVSGVDSVEHTFENVDSIVEIRLALGGERDWDFQWTPFFVQGD